MMLLFTLFPPFFFAFDADLFSLSVNTAAVATVVYTLLWSELPFSLSLTHPLPHSFELDDDDDDIVVAAAATFPL